VVLLGTEKPSVNFADEYDQRASGWSDIVDHLPFLFETVCRYPGATVLELGTRSGESTAAFLAACEAVDGHLWSVDVNKPRVPDWWFGSDRWSVHVGDDMHDDVLDFIPPVVDVLFIDTSHFYDHTLAELDRFVPHVRPGGVVLMHDTELEDPEGVKVPPFPVAKALDDFCSATDFEWVNRPGCFGLGVMEVR
jgi:predicted O-methyltransferase YrrM